MDIGPILDFAGYAIYTSMALAALYGAYCVILLVQHIQKKRFGSESAAEQFLGEIRDRLQQPERS